MNRLWYMFWFGYCAVTLGIDLASGRQWWALLAVTCVILNGALLWTQP